MKKLLREIEYRILYIAIRFVALLPDWFMYSVALVVFNFILHKVFRYRVTVVRENLHNSFPEKSAEELRDIEKRFYKHFAEVFVDSLMMSGLSVKKASERIVFLNYEETMRKIGNRNWIAALAHYGSWEYFCAFQNNMTKQVIGVYRPLSSKSFDRYYNTMRSRFGLLPVPMNELMRYILRNKNSERGFVIGLLADQTPPMGAIDYWYDFLNQKTAFFPGIEKTARKFNLPVIFVTLEKVAKAHYTASMEILYDGFSEVEDREITKRYIARLEKMIVEKPEYWMWSHKRWKHKPPK